MYKYALRITSQISTDEFWFASPFFASCREFEAMCEKYYQKSGWSIDAMLRHLEEAGYIRCQPFPTATATGRLFI